jgi:predicted site-specific integrase-resolvase
MAKVGAQRAAELTGTSKSTIQRAMNKGRLSFEVDPAGRRIIDVSELERVFGIQQSNSPVHAVSVEQELEKASSMLETERLKMRIKMLEEQLDTAQTQVADLKDQRDLWQKQASQVLITSQYSQKQAEELRAEIKEREQRARERRQEQQQLEQKVQKLKTRAENENQSAAEAEENFNFKGLWKRVKGARG